MNPRRLLIVSPHFPPVNAPDMQRIRMNLPHFVAAGWEVTVLTVDDPTPLAPLESELLDTVPAAVRVVRAHCCSRRWTRWVGVNNVALRALPFLFLAGCRLLAGRRYDAVYFSTTMFIVLPFGRIWRGLYGTPYVIDLQDPWVTDFYEQPGAPRPPGGWKYRIARGLGRLLEGWTLRRVAQLITVSAAYSDTIRTRYPDLHALPCTELPFGAPEPDLNHLRAALARRPALLPRGSFRLVFAGALGPGMLGPVEVLFAAMAALRRDGVPVSAHFFGTSYAQAGENQPVTLALAARYVLQECVHEQPDRLPYFSALQVTLEAEVNLLFGSTDLAFTPSKILAVQAAGRPILALAYTGSAMAERLTQIGLPFVPLSPSADDGPAIAATISALRRLVGGGQPCSPPPAHLSVAGLATRQMDILASVSARRS
jgi:hypothetical protein